MKNQTEDGWVNDKGLGTLIYCDYDLVYCDDPDSGSVRKSYMKNINYADAVKFGISHEVFKWVPHSVEPKFENLITCTVPHKIEEWTA